MIVADYIADFLVKAGIRHVFGYQGGAILKLIDAMIDTGKIEYIQNYHEQASAFCADAYARLSGNLGVALGTSGPGATNLVTGIANAQLDSVPTLFITGQDFSSRLIKAEGTRSNGFQDLDIVSIVKPITKYATTITDENRIRYECERALHEAKSGRPGAVLLDIPIDIQFKDINPEALEGFTPPVKDRAAAPSNDEIKKFFDLLSQACRPVILAGGGVRSSHAIEDLKQFSNASGIPVALTLNGLDACEGAIGFSGLYGNTYTNLAVYHADVLIVLGARLGQHQVGKAKETYTKAKVIHIDIDPTELNRAFGEDVSICADIKTFLQVAAAQKPDLPSYAAWHQTIAGWTEKYWNSHIPTNETLPPVGLVRELSRRLQKNAIILADVGQNQMWLAQGLDLIPSQRLLNSSGLGSMGYALPASVASGIISPDSQVIAFMGDGGFQMNIQELQLIAQRQMDIKIFVLNNRSLGLIGYAQDKYFKGRKPGFTAPDFSCVNLEKIAAAYGIGFERISSLSEADKLDKILSVKGPVLTELVIGLDNKLANRNEEMPVLETECAE